MTLEEAIKHCYEVAEKLKNENCDCANEHKQLAEWLEELKQRDGDRANKIIDVADEYAGEWIPVSERLPKVMDNVAGEFSDDVLICVTDVTDSEYMTISTGFYGYYPTSKSQQGWWSMWACGCHQLDSEYKVVAWMPLPPSYQGE